MIQRIDQYVLCILTSTLVPLKATLIMVPSAWNLQSSTRLFPALDNGISISTRQYIRALSPATENNPSMLSELSFRIYYHHGYIISAPTIVKDMERKSQKQH
jgi:hypothetical protein